MSIRRTGERGISQRIIDIDTGIYPVRVYKKEKLNQHEDGRNTSPQMDITENAYVHAIECLEELTLCGREWFLAG